MLIPNIVKEKLVFTEFDRTKHMHFAETIMDLDEELSAINYQYQPAPFIDNPSFGKISYEKYINLLLENNWRLFLGVVNNQCVGYVHAVPGKYKRSIYIGSFIVSKDFTGRGYGRQMMKQFEQLVKKDYNLITLIVSVDNRQALRLYEKSGFKTGFYQQFKKI